MADLLDPRQRLAAAILLSAIDLPAPVEKVADLWLTAAKVSPGIMVSKAFLNDRRSGLRAAREIIDQLLAEMG